MTKKYLSALLAFVLVAMCSVCSDVAAAETPYNLKFTGKITAQTCDVDSNSLQQTVEIGQFSTSDFPTVGSVTSAESFDINLKNCTKNSVGSKVWFSGVADNDNPALLKLTNTGMGSSGIIATGIGVEILDNNQSPIAINNSDSTVFPLKAGANTLTFYLRYKSTLEAVTEGDATAVMYFDLEYQ
ncbi:fimbrial protein [Lelliottia sp. CFBP8978]|jgi:type 1 fimbria pilin|nr:fimbrial protein [Lelliottia sp. CFBP8978]MDY1038703.1 fimbrial protein [Lelliottia sp. CFBP8978]